MLNNKSRKRIKPSEVSHEFSPISEEYKQIYYNNCIFSQENLEDLYALFLSVVPIESKNIKIGDEWVEVSISDTIEDKDNAYREALGEPTVDKLCALLSKYLYSHPEVLSVDIMSMLPQEILEQIISYVPLYEQRSRQIPLTSKQMMALYEKRRREYMTYDILANFIIAVFNRSECTAKSIELSKNPRKISWYRSMTLYFDPPVVEYVESKSEFAKKMMIAFRTSVYDQENPDITSMEFPEKMPENLQPLVMEYRGRRDTHDYPVFSREVAIDIISTVILPKVQTLFLIADRIQPLVLNEVEKFFPEFGILLPLESTGQFEKLSYKYTIDIDVPKTIEKIKSDPLFASQLKTYTRIAKQCEKQIEDEMAMLPEEVY